MQLTFPKFYLIRWNGDKTVQVPGSLPLFLKLIFIGVLLIYNVLVSAVQQRIGYMYTHIHTFLDSIPIKVITEY